MMSHFTKALLLALLFVFSSSALANNVSQETQAEMRQIIQADKNENDDFHKILEDMWGSFIFGKTDSPPTLLAQVVGYTNVLALVLGVIIVTYVSLASVINSAQSGEVLGRQWNSYWLPIRTAMAFGLLVPTQAGAFALSTAQVIVIKLIIMASTSATFLWNKAVDSSLSLSSTQTQVVLPYKLAYETSLTLTCSLATARSLRLGNPDVVTFRYTDGSAVSIKQSEATMNNGTSSFTSAMNRVRANTRNDRLIESISFWDGSCGDISFNIPSFEDDKYSAFSAGSGSKSNNTSLEASVTIANAQLKAYQDAYLNYIEDFATEVFREGSVNSQRIRERRNEYELNNADRFGFESVAESYVNELRSSDRPFSLTDTTQRNPRATATTAQKIVFRMVHYKLAIDRFIQSVEQLYSFDNQEFMGNVNLPSEQLRSELTRGGWLYAGTFFYKISQIESKAHQSSSAMISGSSGAGLIKCSRCDDSSRLEASGELLSLMYKSIYISPIKIDNASDVLDGSPPKHMEAIGVPLVSMHSMNDGVNTSIISSAISSYAVKALNYLGESSLYSTNLTDGSIGNMDNSNPFQYAVNIGHGMNNVRYALMAFKLGATTFVYTIDYAKDSADSSLLGLTGVGAAASPVLALLKAAAMMALEIIQVAMVLLTAMAWVLAYYIPMMPALLWITLVGAYLLIVIESVVATPLAVILMATPEGEGISGSKMQNAITLLASVYLRPSLMIVGLVAAIYVAKYSFMILNTIFWSQAESAVSGDLFAFFATFSLYIASLHQILSNSIKSMDSLPTAILNWIGQGANAQFGQNEISAAGDQLSQKENAFGKTGDGFKSVFQNRVSNMRREDLKTALDKGRS